MSIVKSFSVGNGDMFFVDHNSDNFTIIDCCITDDTDEDILSEIAQRSSKKQITRFISSHPDDDHLRGLTTLNDRIPIVNFYCVQNAATKDDDETNDFIKYCELRDSKKVFYIFKGCKRKWMNFEGDGRDSSCIYVLWPDTSNEDFQWALEDAAEGFTPNNISPIIEYCGPAANFVWMGDLETEFMEAIKNDLSLPKVAVLFAPHHGRDSGKVPQELLGQMQPKLIVIGEAPSQHLNYYAGYNTITQNSAGDITFDCDGEFIHIYVSNRTYSVDFLSDCGLGNSHGYYIGSLSGT